MERAYLSGDGVQIGTIGALHDDRLARLLRHEGSVLVLIVIDLFSLPFPFLSCHRCLAGVRLTCVCWGQSCLRSAEIKCNSCLDGFFPSARPCKAC